MVLFNFEDIKFTLNRRRELKKWLASIAVSESKVLSELNYIFCSDSYLLQINKEYLNHDYYTDVITFDYVEGNTVSGDIFISIDTVKENASAYSQSFTEELYRVMAHGLLHLCGYADFTDDEKQLMTRMEDKYLSLSPLYI